MLQNKVFKIFFLLLFIYYFWLHWVFTAALGLSPVVGAGRGATL